MLEATGGPREGVESSRSDALTGEGRDMGWSVAAVCGGGLARVRLTKVLALSCTVTCSLMCVCMCTCDVHTHTLTMMAPNLNVYTYIVFVYKCGGRPATLPGEDVVHFCFVFFVRERATKNVSHKRSLLSYFHDKPRLQCI